MTQQKFFTAAAFPLLAVCLLGQPPCGGLDEPCEVLAQQDDDGVIPAIALVQSFDGLASDAATIEDWQAECDYLYLSVGYSGGCAQHAFEVAGISVFDDQTIVQTDIFLSHNANGDACEAYTTEGQTYDLTPLKSIYQSNYGSEGILRVNMVGPNGEDLFFFDYKITE